METQDTTGNVTEIPLCGLLERTSLVMSSGRLWGYGPAGMGDPDLQTWTLRAWEVQGTSSGPLAPVIDAENVAGSGAPAALTYLRRASAPDRLLVLSVPDDPPQHVRVDVFDSGAGALAAPLSFFFDCPTADCTGASAPSTVAMEGDLLMRAGRGALSVWSATDPSQPSLSLPVPEATPDTFLDLLAMAQHRAWVGYLDSASQPTLMELSFGTTDLRNVGVVVLSGTPRAALVQGQHAVVPTSRGVEIVGPACVR